MSVFAELMEAELARARGKHPGKQHNLHEAYAVLLEEVDEFWDQVKLRTSQRSATNIREELVQIAAMAMRSAEDLGFVASERCCVHDDDGDGNCRFHSAPGVERQRRVRKPSPPFIPSRKRH